MSRRRVATRLCGLLAAAACAALAAPGCSFPEVSAPVRFIEDDAGEILEVSDLSERVVVFSWRFASAEDLAPWQASDMDQEFAVAEAALRLRSSSARAALVRDVDLDSRQVDVLEIRLREPRSADLEVSWAREGQRFSDRDVALATPLTRRGGDRVYRVPLGSQRHWTGRIRRLRFGLSRLAASGVQIEAITGFAQRAAADETRAALQRPWKVELDRDLRNALLTPPDAPFEGSFDVPEDAELRFGFGVLSGISFPAPSPSTSEAAEPPVFRVRVTAADAEPEILFERSANADAESGWGEAALDLSRYAGQHVRIALESASAGPATGVRGLAAWAHPEIVSRARGARPPNVVLISIDTLRADRLSLNGYTRPTTPNIDAWARRVGVNFSRTVASAPWTLPSHVSIFSGLDALTHGVNYRGPAHWPETLPEMLRRSNYLSMAVTGGAILHHRHGFQRGFDSFRYREGADELATNMDHVLERLRSAGDRPFFLFFHTYEVHSPYRVRQPHHARLGLAKPADEAVEIWCGLVGGGAATGFVPSHQCRRQRPDGTPLGILTPAGMRLASDLYDSGVAEADAQIGRLLERLDAPDLHGNTLVVLTSDHGEALGEQGRVGHHHLEDHNLLVPLVLAFPRRLEGGQSISRQVRSTDILPTLLELLGREVPAGLDGVSLVPQIEAEPSRISDSEGIPGEAWSYAAYSNRGVSLRVDDRLKLRFSNSAWHPAAGRERRFDLREDPEERSGRAPGLNPGLNPAGGDDADALREKLRRKLHERPGLRIRLSNGTDRSLTGRLRGAATGGRRLKSPDMPCACLTWEPAPGNPAAVFRVPAHTAYTLVVEQVGEKTLTLQGALAARSSGPAGNPGPEATAGEAFSFDVEPAGLAGPRGVVLAADGWQAWDPAQGAPATGVSVEWQGGASAATSTAERDPALERRLRALGYIE